MKDKLTRIRYRIEQWSNNYEYEIEGYNQKDNKLKTFIKHKTISFYPCLIIIFLGYLLEYVFPSQIISILSLIVNPLFFYKNILPEIILFFGMLFTLYFYFTLINFALNKFDLNYLKNIGWKSSFIIILFFGFWIGMGWFFASICCGETSMGIRLFSIDPFYIFFPIIILILIFLIDYTDPSLKTVIMELARQKNLNLISEEKYLITKNTIIEDLKQSGYPEEDLKEIESLFV